MYVVSFDIETDTAVNGLDPAVAAITEVSITTPLEDVVFSGKESQILQDVDELMMSFPEGIFSTYNGAGFDIGFCVQRSAITGVKLGLRAKVDLSIPLKYGPLPGHSGAYRARWGNLGHLDIWPLYTPSAQRLGVRDGLKPVYEALTGKKPIEVDREVMHLLSPEERRAYAASDTRITRELTLLLPSESLVGDTL